MKASVNKKIHDVYVNPLPYVVKPLPPLIVHNPLSVLYYLYAVYFWPNPDQVRIAGELDWADPTRSIHVRDPKQMARLWEMGFFGKGTLSRSEPSWFGRTSRRLGFDGGELTIEEITEERRQKRRQFKKEREIAEKQELARKQHQEGIISEMPTITLEEDKEETVDIRPEDHDIIRGNTIVKLETLQLMPCEAIFLSAGLGVLDIHDHTGPIALPSLLAHLCDSKLFLEYIIYHYFRSLGWCVRSGVKFATDFVLYTRGPPFQHAEFAVTILHAGHDETREWYWNQSVARVVGGVKKTLIFAYVEGPDPKTIDWTLITSISKFESLLRQYTVQTIAQSRWSPNRTRD